MYAKDTDKKGFSPLLACLLVPAGAVELKKAPCQSGQCGCTTKGTTDRTCMKLLAPESLPGAAGDRCFPACAI